MALLLRLGLIGFENLIDDACKAIEFRSPHRLLAPVAGRHSVAQHLAHGFPCQPEPPGRLPLANPLDKNTASHLSIQLHLIHPSCVPQNASQMFYGHTQAV